MNTPSTPPITVPEVDAEQARCIEIDRSYAHYKDSGAKAAYEIEVAHRRENNMLPCYPGSARLPS